MRDRGDGTWKSGQKDDNSLEGLVLEQGVELREEVRRLVLGPVMDDLE